MSQVQRFTANTQGRDLIVGDVHGCFTRLREALDDVAFDESVDRLFSVGDLIDRGPESLQVESWLDAPWFHSILGNHEQMAMMYAEGLITDKDHITNGGQWLIGLEPPMQRALAARFAVLPVLIELETAQGLVGIVHAECPADSWARLVAALNRQDEWNQGVTSACIWSRTRIYQEDVSLVPDVRAVVCGHTIVIAPLTLGNHLYIDTMGWHPRGDGFTVLDAATLQPAQRPLTKSESGL